MSFVTGHNVVARRNDMAASTFPLYSMSLGLFVERYAQSEFVGCKVQVFPPLIFFHVQICHDQQKGCFDFVKLKKIFKKQTV